MTRRHFIAIARALSFSRDAMGAKEFRALCERMASELAVFNPSFPRSDFLAACGAEW